MKKNFHLCLRKPSNFLHERQINTLREEKAVAEETVELEREEVAKFQEKSEEWSKRQKKELLDKIAKLEQENNSYEKEIAELKEQVEKLNSQLNSQIEVPAKDKGFKGFFKFGGRSNKLERKNYYFGKIF